MPKWNLTPPKIVLHPSGGSAFAPIKPAQRPKTPMTLWVASSLAVYTAAALDMHATEQNRQLYQKYPGYFYGDYEADPFARPFVRLPAPAYYACGIAMATGVNWLGFRMSRSPRFHKIWWLPQALSVAGNTRGYMTTLVR